jgi:CheY-like chemotaxis protein
MKPKRQLLILVVDDDRDQREALRELLEISGYRVVEAANGYAALTTLRTLPERPDVVLCDIEMPLMNGLELMQTIRDETKNNPVPVILFSAVPSLALIGERLGAKGLTKPLDYQRLLELVARV